jgi:hypothetical protein
VRTMKETVAIVGVTGLCRAAEFGTDQRPDAATVTTPQPAAAPPPATAIARARDLIAETIRATAIWSSVKGGKRALADSGDATLIGHGFNAKAAICGHDPANGRAGYDEKAAGAATAHCY